MIYAVFGPVRVEEVIFTDYAPIYKWLNTIQDIDKLLLGGGKGVDDLVLKYCRENAISHEIVKPNLKAFITYEQAFAERNAKMFQGADELIIFWDGFYRPMANLISLAVRTGKKVICLPLL